MKPTYPIYIPSRSRWTPESNLTARVLDQFDVPFLLVVEPHQADQYVNHWGPHRVLTLPFRDRGSVIPARNWIKEHAIDKGHRRHWQFDDNIRCFYVLINQLRLRVNPAITIRLLEAWTDQYTNIGISGFSYKMFVPDNQLTRPFFLNCHVYSASLIRNDDFRFRGTLNEDTDYCLQVLASGECTALINQFMVDKAPTMTMSGGNTEQHYSAQDGRLRMARALEKQWPGVVTTRRRFGRPQHVVKDQWKRFDQPLIRDPAAEPIPQITWEPHIDHQADLHPRISKALNR